MHKKHIQFLYVIPRHLYAMVLLCSHTLLGMHAEQTMHPIPTALPPELQVQIAQELVRLNDTATEAVRDVKNFFRVNKGLSEHLYCEQSMGEVARTIMKRFDVSEIVARNNLRKNEAVEQWYERVKQQKRYYPELLREEKPPSWSDQFSFDTQLKLLSIPVRNQRVNKVLDRWGGRAAQEGFRELLHNEQACAKLLSSDEKKRLFHTMARKHKADLAVMLLRYLLGSNLVPDGSSFTRERLMDCVYESAMERTDGASLLQILIWLGYDVRPLTNESICYKKGLLLLVTLNDIAKIGVLINAGGGRWPTCWITSRWEQPEKANDYYDRLYKMAVSGGNTAIVRLLVNAGLFAWGNKHDQLNELIEIAINKGDMEMVKLLQAVGARNDLLSMVMHGTVNEIEHYLRDNESKKRDVLCLAVLCARPDVVSFLLDSPYWPSEIHPAALRLIHDGSPYGIASKNVANPRLLNMHKRYNEVIHLFDSAYIAWWSIQT